MSSGMVGFRLHFLAVCQNPAHPLQLLKAWWAGNCSSLINTSFCCTAWEKSDFFSELEKWEFKSLLFCLLATGFGSSNLHGVWQQHSWRTGECEVVVHPFPQVLLLLAIKLSGYSCSETACPKLWVCSTALVQHSPCAHRAPSAVSSTGSRAVIPLLQV